MSSVFDEGYAEEQRQAHDFWFGDPGYLSSTQEAEREEEADDDDQD